MPVRGFSRKPSPYKSRILFHGIRIVQFLSSAIVLSILAYFVAALTRSSYYIPWTFITLLSVSAFTILSVLISSGFYHTRAITPRMSIFINAGLVIIWGAGLGCMTWYLWNLLTNECTIANWDHDTGVKVCVAYKTLEFFTCIAFLTTLASSILDLWTIRQGASRGLYNPMEDSKHAFATDEQPLGNAAAPYGAGGVGDQSHGFRDASMDYGRHESMDLSGPNHNQQQYGNGGIQTSYRGAGGYQGA